MIAAQAYGRDNGPRPSEGASWHRGIGRFALVKTLDAFHAYELSLDRGEVHFPQGASHGPSEGDARTAGT